MSQPRPSIGIVLCESCRYGHGCCINLCCRQSAPRREATISPFQSHLGDIDTCRITSPSSRRGLLVMTIQNLVISQAMSGNYPSWENPPSMCRELRRCLGQEWWQETKVCSTKVEVSPGQPDTGRWEVLSRFQRGKQPAKAKHCADVRLARARGVGDSGV